MFVVDTNVLVYAANEDCIEHPVCRRLVESWRTSSLPWYLTWSIAYEFLRVTTHPRIFPNPWLVTDTWAFLAGLTDSPGLRFLVQGRRHMRIAEMTLKELPDLQGNLLHDSHTALLMREHGIRRIYTRDTDFHRFPFLEIIDPMREQPR